MLCADSTASRLSYLYLSITFLCSAKRNNVFQIGQVPLTADLLIPDPDFCVSALKGTKRIAFFLYRELGTFVLYRLHFLSFS